MNIAEINEALATIRDILKLQQARIERLEKLIEKKTPAPIEPKLEERADKKGKRNV